MEAASAGQLPGAEANKIGRIKPPKQGTRKGASMGRIIKFLIILMILGFIGLTVYAYLGDLAPVQGEVTKPVVLDAN
jgi:hypothetical protein